MKIAVFANCQASPIGLILKRLASRLDLVEVPPVHTIPTDRFTEVADILGSADIVLAQPMSEKYGVLSSDALKDRRGNRILLSFASLYFDGTFPFLTVLRGQDKRTLKGPLGDYHDLRIVRSYLSGRPPSADVLNGLDPRICYRELYEASLMELERHEEMIDIKTAPIIRRLAPDVRTFHTFNHPTNQIMWHVALDALRILDISPASHPMPSREYLDHVVAAIPPELSETLGLAYAIPNYRVAGADIEPRAIVSDFYKFYDGVPNFEAMCKGNSIVA